MSDFQIRSYTKKELALCYLPTAVNAHSAVNMFMGWVYRNQPLCEALERTGYSKTARWLTPAQVRLIVDYLGEP